MANTILLKRSTTAPDPGTVLGAGEPAYSYNSGKLYVGNANGSGNAAIAIGGPGVFALYAPLASPIFTGDPTAPTPALSDNDTSIATTAFVKGQAYQTGNSTITVSGDATGSGTNAIALTLSTSGVVAGTYPKVTVDAKGRVTLGAALLATDIPTLTANKISDFDVQARTSRLDQFAIPTAAVSFNAQRITNVGSPTVDTDAANKAYVDAARAGLDVKDSVRVSVATNVNVASPGATLDGIAMVSGDRILLRGQTAGPENGIYVFNAAATALTRATDADSNAEVTAGLFTFVEDGTSADAAYVLATNNPIALGTTSLSFTQFSGAGQITPGAGLTKTGDTLDVNTASSTRIVINADSIDLATIGTAGTFFKTTSDAYGRTTAGINPTTLVGFGITDAQPLDAELSAISALATSGMIVKTASGTAATRTITGTTNRLTVTNGDGIAGNPTLDLAATYIGQNTITTLGTIGTGVWNGTTIAIANGGTGNTAYVANRIPFSNGTILTSDPRLAWDNTSFILTVNGNINSATIDGGSF